MVIVPTSMWEARVQSLVGWRRLAETTASTDQGVKMVPVNVVGRGDRIMCTSPAWDVRKRHCSHSPQSDGLHQGWVGSLLGSQMSKIVNCRIASHYKFKAELVKYDLKPELCRVPKTLITQSGVCTI